MRQYAVSRLGALLSIIFVAYFGWTPAAKADSGTTSAEEDKKAVATLDLRYQAAVKANDAATMNTIFHDDFTLVNGRGIVSKKSHWIKWAENKTIIYERQEHVEGTQTVRVWGNTAVVTALLWIKGTVTQDDKEFGFQKGKQIDVKLWYSDTYVRTSNGWLYAFGQASLPLPEPEKKQEAKQ